MANRPTVERSTVSAVPPKPRDDELDFFGLTHPGLVRKENQDHFLLCTLHKSITVKSTSLPNPEILELKSQRLASFSMVADGVGGRAGGEEASRAALEAVASYATHTMECFYSSDMDKQGAFLEALREAALECHNAVVKRAKEAGLKEASSTTLTGAVGVWPHLYILQVGDSRCYRHRNGQLQLLTRDQTVAQDLVDSGILPEDRARWSPFAHVLSSAVGGNTQPVVTVTDLGGDDDVFLICTDGLTKHVSDEKIAERLRTMTSSEQVCRALIQDALDGGGTDNVTAVVLRVAPKK